MKVRMLLVGALLWCAPLSVAFGQCGGQAASGYACGNGAASTGFASFYPLSTLFDRGIGSGQGTILNRTNTGWVATVAPTLGLNGGTGGSIALEGATSGAATISVPAAAGSVLFQLPSSNGSNNQVLTTDGAGHLSWVTLTGTGTVTSVGLSMPGIFTVTGSPVTVSGTLTASLNTQSANTVWAGPSSGLAADPTFRALVGADLPTPTTGSLGGVEANTPVTHEWMNAINTSGVPQLSQPSFSDISGTASGSQLPPPAASTLGGIESYVGVAHQWINSISTSGVPGSTQPNFSDLSGNASLAQLPGIGNNTVIGNNSGGTSTPLALTASDVLDMIGATQGDVLYRGATGWSILGPGTSGQVFTTGGAAANPSWSTITGTGTVTQINAGTGIAASPSPITTTGTVSLASINNGTVLANVSGSSAAPTGTTPSAVLDVVGSTEGSVLYRGASTWGALVPGTSGEFLQTRGAGSTPQWATAVSSISGGGGLVGGIITTTGILAVQQMAPGGRLTLTSGTPITTTDVTNATTIYYAPLTGEYVPIYNGTSQQLYQFTSSTTDTVGLSVTLGSNWAGGSAYDWFVALNGGSPVLCSGPAWSSAAAGSSSRGTGAGTTQLALFDGLYTNAVSITCRTSNTTTIAVPANEGTYVGSSLMTAAGATTDSASQRYVYNLYNQTQRKLKNPTETTNTWTYSTTTWRQANANTADQFSLFVGEPGSLLSVDVYSTADSSPANFMAVGIGINSTNTDSADNHTTCAQTTKCSISAALNTYPGLGLQNYVWLEAVGVSGGANDFYGQQVNSGIISIQSGISGSMLD